VLEYKKKCTDEQCIGQSPVNISDSTRHLQRCVVNYSLHKLAPAPILRDVTWGTLARPWVHPPAQLCCPRVAPERLPSVTDQLLWGNTAAFLLSSSRETSLPYRESFRPGIPASSQFNPFCSWTFLLSMPGHSIDTNYQCWAATIWLSLNQAFQETNHDRLNYIANISLYSWEVQEKARE